MADRIKVSLGENGNYVFQDATEVLNWVQEERQAWRWLTSDANLLSQYKQAWAQITKAAQAAISDPTDDRHRNLIEQSFASYASLIHAKSVVGEFVLGLSDESTGVATSAALAFTGHQAPSPLTSDVFSGFNEATLFQRGNRTSARAARKAFDKSKIRFEQLSSDLEGTRADLEEFKIEAESSITEMRTNWESNAETLLTELRGEQETALAKTDADLVAFKKAYNEDLALAAPVDYWNTRRKEMRNQAIAWSIFFVLLVTAILIVIGTFVPDFLKAANDDTALIRTVALLFLLSTPVIWILRIVARTLLSRLHLMTDAGERKAMIETYLALVADGKMDIEQRELVLAAIFRPTSTGFVKDDATPPGWSSIVTKLVGERK